MQEKHNKLCLIKKEDVDNNVNKIDFESILNSIQSSNNNETIFNKIEKQNLKLDEDVKYKVHPRLLIDQNKNMEIISFDILSSKKKRRRIK